MATSINTACAQHVLGITPYETTATASNLHEIILTASNLKCGINDSLKSHTEITDSFTPHMWND
jgi:hypothetical protein